MNVHKPHAVVHVVSRSAAKDESHLKYLDGNHCATVVPYSDDREVDLQNRTGADPEGFGERDGGKTSGSGSSGAWILMEKDESCFTHLSDNYFIHRLDILKSQAAAAHRVLLWVARKSERLELFVHYTQIFDEMADQHCLTRDLELYHQENRTLTGQWLRHSDAMNKNDEERKEICKMNVTSVQAQDVAVENMVPVQQVRMDVGLDWWLRMDVGVIQWLREQREGVDRDMRRVIEGGYENWTQLSSHSYY